VEGGHEGSLDSRKTDIHASRGLSKVSYSELREREESVTATYRYPWFASAFKPGQGPRLATLPGK
jgi:hypothetical protein